MRRPIDRSVNLHGLLRTGLILIAAIAVIAASALGTRTSADASQTLVAQATPSPRPSSLPNPALTPGPGAMTPAVGPSGLLQPTPFPQYTLGPASVGTSMPFPAYGSPVPGVGVGPAPTGLPQIVTLAQSQQIAFARSPTLASAPMKGSRTPPSGSRRPATIRTSPHKRRRRSRTTRPAAIRSIPIRAAPAS
jgi:hypothetical protein